MASGKKQIQQLARQLFKLSFADGVLSAARVTAVLEYLEKHYPAQGLAVLRAYHRLVAAEVARGQAVVEHAGPVSDAVVSGIATAMTARYRRNITGLSRPAPALIAGLRVRVGDDVYESTVAGQLAALAASA
jgi:F-type H+-transporting ATPase subunit delta